VTVLVQDPDFTLLLGDVREQLRELADGSIDCVMTSPPYFGLRDYGMDGQLGLEPTVGEYVEALVEVFREVRRVLAGHGTVWLNMGDCYANDGKWGGATGGKHANGLHGATGVGRARRSTGLKPKDLVLLPARVALALVDDGWWLRAECIWEKPNAMPESVRDRPSRSHEQVFMLTKSQRYWYDRVAVLEPFEMKPQRRLTPREDNPDAKVHGQPQHRRPDGGVGAWEPPQPDTLPGLPPESPRGADGRRVTQVVARGNSAQHRDGERWPDEGRNMRTVWRIPTQPYHDAHFAVFPEALVERCLLASCPPEVCARCGEPRWRIVLRVGGPQGDHVAAAGNGAGEVDADSVVRQTGHSARAAGQVLSDRYREHGYAQLDTAGWTECGCQAGLRSDDLEIVETPLGENGEPDPTMLTGRRGLGRPRAEDEGTRPITRYEQRAYAAQLRELRAFEVFAEMEEAVGREAMAHYMRTDLAGARPIPPDELEAWLAMGYLKPVEVPEVRGEYRPGVVLDPFLGSGTTALVARRLGRRCVGIELSPEHARRAVRRTQQLSLLA
jgi:DNA modification methylase